MEEAAHIALYTALTGAGLTVRDHVPEPDDAGDDAPFPYVVIGEGDLTRQDTDDTRGADVFFNLRFFSRYQGWKELDQMLSDARDELHMQPLTVTGFDCWDVLCDGPSERVQEAGPYKTREARMRVNVRLEEQ